MKRVIALVALLILFGCLGGGGQNPPPQNNTSTTNNTPPVKIIIGNQTNQTIEKNLTEENTTQPEQPKKDLDYIHDPNALLAVYFIDVGAPGEHGEAVLIKKGDLSVLLDAGAADQGGKVVDFLRAHDVNQLQVLISTTGDPRRYGGIETVAENYKIQQLWWGGDDFGDPVYNDTITKVMNKTYVTKEIGEGYTIDLNGANFTVINPPAKNRFQDVNNDAIVSKLTEGNFSILLTSNIQTGAQGLLINSHPKDIQSKVMDAPYYGVGSGTSNIGVFLLESKPEWMVITGSSDESAPNGGSREPFERLMKQYGISWNASYVNGTIRVATDGKNYTVMALGAGQ